MQLPYWSTLSLWPPPGSWWETQSIACHLSTEFSSSHEEYTSSFCWFKIACCLSFQDYIPKTHEWDKRHTMTYCQWLPFILPGGAVLFYLLHAVGRGTGQHWCISCQCSGEGVVSPPECNERQREQKFRGCDQTDTRIPLQQETPRRWVLCQLMHVWCFLPSQTMAT